MKRKLYGFGFLGAALIIMHGGCRTAQDIRQDETLAKLSKQLDTSQTARADTSMNLEDVKAEMLTLRGKIEENAHRQGQTQTQVDRTMALVDQRLKDFEEKMMARLEVMEKNLATAQAAAAAQSAKSAKVREKGPPRSGSDEEAYSSALSAFETGEFSAAVSEFDKFLEFKPKGQRGATAHLMRAQSLQKLKKHDEAILAFQQFRDQFPKEKRVPDAIIGQALSFEKKGDKSNSKLYYAEVIEKYPGSVQARAATRAVQRLK